MTGVAVGPAAVMRFRMAAGCFSTVAIAAGLPPLPGRPLPYRGVCLDLTSGAGAEALATFESRLASSLSHWQAEGLKSCMLKLPIEQAALAAVAAEHGFVFHHVPLDNPRHVVLKRWLQDGMVDKVPPFATHQVGVAGMCLDPSGQILLVKEWRDGEGNDRVPSLNWKLPGGLLDAGESFGEAAVRETWEETGVRTVFRSLLSFWHRHGLTWGKSDLYYVARLELASADEQIRIDPVEISDCRWMDVDEFLATQDHPLITAVLRRVYGLNGEGDSPRSARGRALRGAPLPIVEMLEGAVQWPGRQPYPTYFAGEAEGDSL